MRKLLPSLVVLWLYGCNLAPPAPDRPEVAAQFAFEDAGADAPLASGLPWREFFGDPVLRDLLAEALANNQDLAAATARIVQLEARYRIQDSLRLPTLNTGASLQRSGATAPGADARTTDTTQAIEVGVPSFELDFWGRVSNLAESARRQYLATIEARQAFRLSLVASVASAYYLLRSSEEGIELAEHVLASRLETLEIAGLRLDAGLTSTIDRDQAHALVNQAEAQLSQLRRTREQSANWLQALSGNLHPPPVPAAGLSVGSPGQLAAFSAGLPSQLLATRPDIRRAEQRLLAANADIGAARAALFPAISLTAASGFASPELSGLFSAGNNYWSAGVGAALPVFDAGRRRAQVEVSRAVLAERGAEYRQAVANAFREVHDGLSALQTNADQVATLQRTVQVQQDLAGTAQARYDVGLGQYLEVLDAQRGLFAAQQSLLQAQATGLQDRVNLYIALGGGDIARDIGTGR